MISERLDENKHGFYICERFNENKYGLETFYNTITC